MARLVLTMPRPMPGRRDSQWSSSIRERLSRSFALHNAVINSADYFSVPMSVLRLQTFLTQPSAQVAQIGSPLSCKVGPLRAAHREHIEIGAAVTGAAVP